MTIRWITPSLGTGPFSAVETASDVTVVDVRDLVDKAGNTPVETLDKILQGVNALRLGKKVVVCCDYGMSRSNAVAVGILSVLQGTDLHASLRQVQKSTGEPQIKLEPLRAVREALGLRSPKPFETELRTLVITGGNGFLGKSLRASLKNYFRVIAPSSAELNIYSGCTELDLLAGEENVKWIVHFANPRIFTSNNALGYTLTMLRNVIDVCLNRDIPLLFPSGWEIYSGYAGTLRADESTPPFPKGPYGETKYLAEKLIQHISRRTGLRCALLRSSPVYGPGGDRPKFMYNFAQKASQSETIVTHHYNTGEPSLDFLHVSDLTSAIVRVLKNDYIGELNLGTGILTSTRHIAQMIKEILNSKSSIRPVSIESDVACIAMDWRKARNEIGWKPKISLQNGLQEMFSPEHH